jgi:hypothetical protein
MNRVWPLAFCLLLIGAASGAEQAAFKPIADGRFLQDVDGRLVHDDVNDVWRFDLTADMNAPGVQVPAGTEFTLLPSAALANMIADSNDRILPLYRLGVIVTQYRGRNYLLPAHFLSLSRLKETGVSPQESGGRPSSAGVEPNTALPVPGWIVEELKGRKPLRAPQRSTSNPLQVATRMLVDVTGFIELRQGQAVFVPDALGLNVSKTEYLLLPSAVLEQAQRLQAAAPDSVRFSVAGQITEFKGKQYLLLQRVIRVYSFGDFTG